MTVCGRAACGGEHADITQSAGVCVCVCVYVCVCVREHADTQQSAGTPETLPSPSLPYLWLIKCNPGGRPSPSLTSLSLTTFCPPHSFLISFSHCSLPMCRCTPGCRPPLSARRSCIARSQSRSRRGRERGIGRQTGGRPCTLAPAHACPETCRTHSRHGQTAVEIFRDRLNAFANELE
jgi:hypothetical protein